MIIPKHLSVTTKFVLTFLSVLTVSMAFMGYILYDQSSKAAISQGQILMMQNVLQVKNNVSQKANMVENLSQIIAFDPKIQNFLGNAFMGEPFQLIDYRDQIAPILDNLIRQNPYIRSIRIFMANESIPELYDGFYHLNRLRASPRYSSFLQSASSGEWQGLHPEQTWIAVPGESVFLRPENLFS